MTTLSKSRLRVHGSASVETIAVMLLVGLAGVGGFGVLGHGMDAAIGGEAGASSRSPKAMAISTQAASLGALEQVAKYAEVTERWSARATGVLWRMPMPRSTVRRIAEAAIAAPEGSKGLIESLGDAAPARFFWDNEGSGAPRRLQVLNSLKDTADEFTRLVNKDVAERVLHGAFPSTTGGFQPKEVDLLLRDVWRGRGNAVRERIARIRKSGVRLSPEYEERMVLLSKSFRPGRTAYGRVSIADLDKTFGEFARSAESRQVDTLGRARNVASPFKGLPQTVLAEGTLAAHPALPRKVAPLYLSELAGSHPSIAARVTYAYQLNPSMTADQAAVLRAVLEDLSVELQADAKTKGPSGHYYVSPASYKTEAARRALQGDTSGIALAERMNAGLSTRLEGRLEAVAKIMADGIAEADFNAVFGK